jgi:zinc-binding alcohol dehydrogenase family protein
MKAVGLTQYLPADNPESLLDVEVPPPTPTGRDLLVRVHAVSVNPVDVKSRAPRPGTEATPRILGWDAAGVVEAVGPGVALFKPGDEVYYAGSIDRAGCDSELHLVDERIVGPKPSTLTFEEAAALPLTTITAWEAIFERLGIAQNPAANAGRTLLIIGGAGGVGSIAIQIAKQVAGLRVIATASRPDSVAWCHQQGAEVVINHRQPLKEALAAAGFATVDYILCTNSVEQYITGMAEIIAPQGKICTIVGTKGNEPIPMNLFMRESVGFFYELMFTRPVFQTTDMQAQHDLLTEAARLVDAGVLHTTLTERFGPLTAANLRLAHARIESGTMIGKLALTGIPS